MKKITVLLTAILIMLMSCARETTYTVKNIDGIEFFKNNGKSAEKNYSPEFKEIMEIKGTDQNSDDPERNFSRVCGILVDSEKNIFIGDYSSSSVKKFDKGGNFLLSFGGNGSGPGEFVMMGDLSIINDTINVYDPAANKIVKFNGKGEFLGNKEFSQNNKPMFLAQAGQDRIIGLKAIPEMKDKKLYFPVSVQLYNMQFKELNKIDKRELIFDLSNPSINPTDLFTPFCFNSDKIFVGDVSEDFFKIKVYDFAGKQLQEIKNNYRRTEMTAKQRELFKGAVQTDGEDKNNLTKAYNKAIEEMFYDKAGRIWVKKAQAKGSKLEGCAEFDIFKDGIFINTVKLEAELVLHELTKIKSVFYFYGDYIYLAEEKEGEVAVRILDYS